jgi:hypothetical protein
VNDDDLDRLIRETQHRYADTIHSTRDAVPGIFARVRRDRRRRRAFMTVAAAAVTAGVIGAVALSGDLLSGEDSGQITDPAPTTSPSAPPSSPTTAVRPRTLEGALATQLAADPAVREYLLGHPPLQGAVLCSTHVFGGERSHEHLYVWVNCGTYSTGPGAEELSGGGDPAVLTVTGRGADTTIMAVQLPRIGHHDQDIAAMFPARVVAQVQRREFQTFPAESQLLAEARSIAPQ